MTCEHCKDRGFVLNAEQNTVTRCVCRSVTMKQRIADISGIPPRFQGKGFHDFEIKTQAQQRAKDTAMQIVRLYPASKGVLFMGTPGTGKTHLAVAILRNLMETKQVACRFFDFVGLMKSVQSSYDANSGTTAAQLIKPVLETQLVLIDDVGSMQMSAATLESLGHIINERYNAGCVTLLTTNWFDTPKNGDQSLEQRIGSRLRSRLHEMCQTIVIEGKDYRRDHAHRF